MDDEDSINLEALQAQIDMSMAFAEEMVSSWVKPSRKLSRSKRDLEAELKEYMRRPPRLGVGAAIPETASSSRDTARLKGQLVGKGNKRSRENEMDPKEKDATDGEEEIRGGVIKKKARIDPFANDSKKKKKRKADPETVPLAPELLAPEAAEEVELAEVVNLVTEDIPAPSTPLVTPKRKKHKKKHPTSESSLDIAQTPASPASLRAPATTCSSLPPNNQSEKSTTPPTERRTDVDISTTTATPLQSRSQAQSALLKFPLLNLTPIRDHESENEDDARDSSPKKKRKRKKKRKKGESSASVAVEVSAALS